MMRRKSDDAVSPVIGVMLLLVVTIVIAAVVAVFASGVGTEAEPAPATVLNVNEICDGGSSKKSTPSYRFDVSEYKKKYGDASLKTHNIEYTNEKGETKKSPVQVDSATGEYLFEIILSDKGKPVYDYSQPKNEKAAGCLKRTENYPVTLTLSSTAGNTLDLSKLSVKVYNSKGTLVAEKHQNSLSGTISPGDTITLTLDELYDETKASNTEKYNSVIEREKVEVFVLHGEHVIVSKELKVVGL